MPRLAVRPRIGRHHGVRPLEPLARIRRLFYIQSRIGRELIIFGSALVLGLVVVPLLIWVVGNRILGPYTHGTNPHAGPMALLGEFYDGLSRGWLSYWIVALGPLVIIVFVRAAWELVVPKRNTNAKPSTPNPNINGRGRLDPVEPPAAGRDKSPDKSNSRRIEPTIGR